MQLMKYSNITTRYWPKNKPNAFLIFVNWLNIFIEILMKSYYYMFKTMYKLVDYVF